MKNTAYEANRPIHTLELEKRWTPHLLEEPDREARSCRKELSTPYLFVKVQNTTFATSYLTSTDDLKI